MTHIAKPIDAEPGAKLQSLSRHPVNTIADTIYRRFFISGVGVVVTAGAAWGAYMLWRIGLVGKMTAVSAFDVNAHGNAQISGWMGLFIMGFALHAFPRMWNTRLAAAPLARVVFVAMLVGLSVHTLGMAVHGVSWAVPAAMTGAVLETLAVLIFTGQIFVTFRRSGSKLEPYIGFVLMGLVWFVTQSFMSAWHTWTTMNAASSEELLWYIATYQAPLRNIQIHGMGLFMILGVSIRMLPVFLGLPKLDDRRGWLALDILTVAVIAESAIFVAYRWTHSHAIAALLLVPWLMLIAGVALVALPWKLWRPFSDPEARRDRIGKFVRAAYAWLALSLLMLLLLPVYQWVSGIPFSHAYYGAIRHAVTVGFISLMIMGMSAKVVPQLNGIDPRGLSALWGPFLLVNLGCFLRVAVQTLTDWHPGFFSIIGVSGVLEVAGLAWWGAELLWIMHHRRDLRPLADARHRSIFS